jgi:hypothetical protein
MALPLKEKSILIYTAGVNRMNYLSIVPRWRLPLEPSPGSTGKEFFYRLFQLIICHSGKESLQFFSLHPGFFPVLVRQSMNMSIILTNKSLLYFFDDLDADFLDIEARIEIIGPFQNFFFAQQHRLPPTGMRRLSDERVIADIKERYMPFEFQAHDRPPVSEQGQVSSALRRVRPGKNVF